MECVKLVPTDINVIENLTAIFSVVSHELIKGLKAKTSEYT